MGKQVNRIEAIAQTRSEYKSVDLPEYRECVLRDPLRTLYCCCQVVFFGYQTPKEAKSDIGEV